jgi:putative DNA primase/helicase
MSAPKMPMELRDADRGGPSPHGSNGGDSVSGRQTLNLTDLGNGERLVRRHGDAIRHVTLWKRWQLWDECRWSADENVRIERLAKQTVGDIWGEAKEATVKEERSDIIKHAIRSESDAAIRHMLARAAAEEGIAIRPRDLDRDPWLFNVENGTIELKTALLREHRREDLITKLAPVRYDPDAKCPTWLAFLERVMGGRSELVEFLKRAIGYSLTGDTREQCLFLLHGTGQNGKSTFLEILRALLGDYAVQADFATFLDRKYEGPRNDVARLFGARAVTSSEVGEGKRFNESLIKTLTGSDTIAARFLYSEAFEFRPQFKLWLAANHKPVIRGTDLAIWRRIRLVPFEVTIPESERDEQLTETLLHELPGILAWAVEGCQSWLESGLTMPDDVRCATQKYRDESDILGHFLSDCCEERRGESSAYEPSGKLYEAYRRWATAGGEYVVTQTQFSRQLDERSFQADRFRVNGAVTRVWLGLKLRADALPQPQHAPFGERS